MGLRQIELVRDEDPFTRVGRALILDGGLRLQTKMVLIMMLSVPPNWDFSIRGMAKIARVTKDTMSRMLSELEAAGYVKRKGQERDGGGQFAKAGYLVAGKPIFAGGGGAEQEAGTCPDLPDAEKPDAEKPAPEEPYTEEPYTKDSPQYKNKQSTTKQINSPCSPPEGDKPARKKRTASEPGWFPEGFARFWRDYPRKDGKQAAAKAWDKLKPDRELCRVMYDALKRAARSPEWSEAGGRYIPYFSKWLNQRLWENQGVDLSLLAAEDEEEGWSDAP